MRLKQLRTDKKLSQHEIAKVIGVRPQTYSNYETGTTEPSIEKLKELANYFNVTLDYLCCRDNVSENYCYEDLNNKFNILKDFVNGKSIDTTIIQDILQISFKEGLSRFSFSRTATWNDPPLNGQRIETKFKLYTLKEMREFICNEIFYYGLTQCVDDIHGKFISFERLDEIKRGV